MNVTCQQGLDTISEIPLANMCADDPRALALLNEAIEQIIYRSRGTLLTRKIRLCVDDNCISLPYQVTALQQASICEFPVPINNQWYELLPFGATTYVNQDEPSRCRVTLEDRGYFPTFSSVRESKYLKIYTDKEEGEDAFMRINGLDQNGLPVRSQVGGVWKDGATIDLSLAYPDGLTIGSQLWTAVTAVLKDPTIGPVRVHEVDPTTAVERPIAIYEHNETNPHYKRYLIRGLKPGTACDGTSCGQTTITGLAKLEYYPATDEHDILIVPSLPAIRYMAMSILKIRDTNELQDGAGMAEMAMQQMGFMNLHQNPKEQLSSGISFGSLGCGFRGVY